MAGCSGRCRTGRVGARRGPWGGRSSGVVAASGEPDRCGGAAWWGERDRGRRRAPESVVVRRRLPTGTLSPPPPPRALRKTTSLSDPLLPRKRHRRPCGRASRRREQPRRVPHRQPQHDGRVPQHDVIDVVMVHPPLPVEPIGRDPLEPPRLDARPRRPAAAHRRPAGPAAESSRRRVGPGYGPNAPPDAQLARRGLPYALDLEPGGLEQECARGPEGEVGSLVGAEAPDRRAGVREDDVVAIGAPRRRAPKEVG